MDTAIPTDHQWKCQWTNIVSTKKHPHCIMTEVWFCCQTQIYFWLSNWL